MKPVRWNLTKSERLKRTRGVSFEEITEADLIKIKGHRKNQKIMLYKHKQYIWVVPFVETNNEIFLKTLYPSRKYTKLYKKEEIK